MTGGTADAFTLFEPFEAKLEKHQGQMVRAAIELTRTSRSFSRKSTHRWPKLTSSRRSITVESPRAPMFSVRSDSRLKQLSRDKDLSRYIL